MCLVGHDRSIGRLGGGEWGFAKGAFNVLRIRISELTVDCKEVLVTYACASLACARPIQQMHDLLLQVIVWAPWPQLEHTTSSMKMVVFRL